MFTGIIEQQGKLIALEKSSHTKGLGLRIATGFSQLEHGESVATNGVCLTVTEHFSQSSSSSETTFFASPETLDLTNLGSLKVGDRVNLERSLSVQGRLSGHIVQGHIDGMGELTHLTSQPGSNRLTIKLPRALGRYCVQKGSIALNGISLTLFSVLDLADQSTQIEVMIIPHTWSHTNLSCLQLGDKLNVEVDLLSKYVERLCQR